MSTAFWYVVLPLLPLVAIGYVVWAYRKKAAEKDAASRERMAALILPTLAGGAASAPRAAAATVGAPPVTAAPPPAPAPSTPRHDPLLSKPETLMYYVLKAGLKDHEVFPRVSLAAVVETPPENPFPPQPGGRQPAQHDFDFVICDKSMKIVAVVQLHGQAPSPWADLVYRRLNAAGVKLVRVDPQALPRREQVRALVLGPSA